VLQRMDGHGAMAAALIEAIRDDLTCHTEMQAYYLLLPTDWETFLGTLHGKRRKKFRRMWKDSLPGSERYGIHTFRRSLASLKPSIRSMRRSRPRAIVLGPGGL
jgi:hypothetical protein